LEIPTHDVASTQQHTVTERLTLPESWVASQMSGQPYRVTCLSYEGQRIWVKRPAPTRPAGLYRALRLVAWLHGLSVLTPAPRPGGAKGLQLEAARLKSLKQLGIRVPDVLLVNEQYLCLSDLPGHDLTHYMQAADTKPLRGEVWKKGLEAILDVHQRGTYISQCFSRNMIASPELASIGFIDFEDDPGLIIDTTHAQARDWLLYLLSTAVWVQTIEDRHSVLIETLQQESLAVCRLFWQALHRLTWFRHLPPTRKWGKDAWWLQAAAQLGYECVQQMKNRTGNHDASRFSAAGTENLDSRRTGK